MARGRECTSRNNYAILGDDVVIADEKVAQESKKLMDDCEVTISKEKSLVSTTGAMEFAKRFIADDGRNDLSFVKGVERDITLCRHSVL